MRIVHITSLHCLEQILSSRRFIAASNNPFNADAGLNCFDSKKAGNKNQVFENDGAILVCHWSGAVANVGLNHAPPYKPNILYDMLPWRCFIPVGSKGTNLRAVGFLLSERVMHDAIGKEIPFWLPNKFKNMIFRKRKLALLRRLRSYLRDGACYLNVV